jgi:mannose-6-phosphate isomerase-like protein (cupin superfamily)
MLRATIMRRRLEAMEVRARADTVPFRTADGSTIRSLLDLSVAPVRNQSLAEAELAPGAATERHFHGESEELYYVIAGTGRMELDGETQTVQPGDAILIPPRAWHQIRATGDEPLRFLCCCAPPYRHEDTFFTPTVDPSV